MLALGAKYIGELALSVPPGTYDDSVVVEIQSDVEDVDIHYTLDGSIPDQFSDQYAGGIVINDNSVLNAIAYKDGYVPSSMISGLYVITKHIGELTLSLPPGSYDDSVTVEIHSALEGVYIHYSLDGTIPDQSSTAYSGEITIRESSTLNAIAYKDGWVPSSVLSANYTISNTSGIVPQSQNRMKLHPTLVSDAINLEISSDMSGDYTFRIYDYSGKLHKSLSLVKTTFNSSERIDLSDLDAGTYVVVIRQGEFRHSSKIVKL